MENKRDYYEVLGVTKTPPGADKKAYRKRLFNITRIRIRATRRPKKKFKEAAEAYDVLSDEKKRQLYDQYGHAMGQQGDFPEAEPADSIRRDST